MSLPCTEERITVICIYPVENIISLSTRFFDHFHLVMLLSLYRTLILSLDTKDASISEIELDPG